ncbi:hypothetical protein Tco_1276839 [Tanacetum coccineum]
MEKKTMVKKSKDLHTVSYDQLFAYLKQNDDEENEIRAESATGTHDPLALVAKTCNALTLYINPTPQYNQQMSYAPQQYKSFTTRYPPTNKQLKISSNLKTQANIQDGRVIIQSVPARQTQSCSSNNGKAKASGINVSKNVVDYAGVYVIDQSSSGVFRVCLLFYLIKISVFKDGNEELQIWRDRC